MAVRRKPSRSAVAASSSCRLICNREGISQLHQGTFDKALEISNLVFMLKFKNFESKD